MVYQLPCQIIGFDRREKLLQAKSEKERVRTSFSPNPEQKLS